jgi:hypothetical protein
MFLVVDSILKDLEGLQGAGLAAKSAVEWEDPILMEMMVMGQRLPQSTIEVSQADRLWVWRDGDLERVVSVVREMWLCPTISNHQAPLLQEVLEGWVDQAEKMSSSAATRSKQIWCCWRRR